MNTTLFKRLITATPLQRHTERIITDSELLLENFKSIRKEGIGIDNEESCRLHDHTLLHPYCCAVTVLEITSADFRQAETLAHKEWSSPNSLFTFGFDKRTSQNAILVQLFRGLVHTRKNNWLTAGRHLLYKIYNT